MKHQIKLIFAILLALTTMFSGASEVLAVQSESSEIDEDTTTQVIIEETTTEENTQEENTENSTSPDITDTDDEDIVGKIYLCSRWSSITTTGHLWVYIHNTSAVPITVGLLEVAPDEGVSLATFGFTRSDGFGIYYNMETYRNDKYCDESCISISDDLTKEELEKINKKLLNSNQWNPIINCVFFACSIWNTGGNRFIIPFTYPPVTRLFIKMAGGKEICQMVYQPPENTFKQRGFGSNSYLDHLSQKSLDA